MKPFLAAIAVACAFVLSHSAQVVAPERRSIEVSGSAERWVTPDQFTFKITLIERMEKKEKITIEQQETALRSELGALGVDVAKDLSIYDISSSYFRQKRIRDVLGSKDYRLKLHDLSKIAKLQDIADRLNVGRLDLIDSEHSEITRLRRETKMEAIKAASDKVDYLLGAIGQRAGKPIYIKEEPDETPQNVYSNISSNTSSNSFSLSPGVVASSAGVDSLSFSQIKLRYVIVAKFEIE